MITRFLQSAFHFYIPGADALFSTLQLHDNDFGHFPLAAAAGWVLNAAVRCPISINNKANVCGWKLGINRTLSIHDWLLSQSVVPSAGHVDIIWSDQTWNIIYSKYLDIYWLLDAELTLWMFADEVFYSSTLNIGNMFILTTNCISKIYLNVRFAQDFMEMKYLFDCYYWIILY